MEENFCIFDMETMNYSSAYQSDIAPKLPDPYFSTASNGEEQKKQPSRPLPS
ncbi:MAG: hypothetical protein H6Q68_726 [Firmicutes bacterium]|nr:hypothetical protein [Bacillota bacterium]